MLEKFGKKVVEHLPEILTVGACTGVIAGDIRALYEHDRGLLQES